MKTLWTPGKNTFAWPWEAALLHKPSLSVRLCDYPKLWTFGLVLHPLALLSVVALCVLLLSYWFGYQLHSHWKMTPSSTGEESNLLFYLYGVLDQFWVTWKETQRHFQACSRWHLWIFGQMMGRFNAKSSRTNCLTSCSVALSIIAIHPESDSISLTILSPSRLFGLNIHQNWHCVSPFPVYTVFVWLNWHSLTVVASLCWLLAKVCAENVILLHIWLAQ